MKVADYHIQYMSSNMHSGAKRVLIQDTKQRPRGCGDAASHMSPESRTEHEHSGSLGNGGIHDSTNTKVSMHAEPGRRAIYFDMDGTIADLYGVDRWLEMALGGSARPYVDARPMFDVSRMRDTIVRLRADGWHVGIVTWLFRGATPEYDSAVSKAKRDWLDRFMPTVDEVKIVPYGVPKQDAVDVRENAILVDDDARNMTAWNDDAMNRRSIDASNRHTMFAALNMLAYGDDAG